MLKTSYAAIRMILSPFYALLAVLPMHYNLTRYFRVSSSKPLDPRGGMGAVCGIGRVSAGARA